MGPGLLGQEAVVQPDRLGCGRRRSSSPSRSTSPAPTRRCQGRSGRPGRRALWRQPGVEPAAGVRPGRDGLQRRAASTSSSSTATCSPRSSAAPITTWNDPAIAALNSGATLPDDQDHADLPLGLVGHHRQLPEVPGRRGARRPGPRARARSSRAAPARARRSRRRRAGHPGHPGCDRLRGEGLRRTRRACRSRRSTRGSGRGRADRRHAPKAAIDAAKFEGRGQGPGARPERAVRHQGGRRLPADAGDLRDRLLEGLRRRHRRCGEVVPDGRGQPGSGRTCRPPATSRCRTRSRSDCSSPSTQSRSCRGATGTNSGEDGCWNR